MTDDLERGHPPLEPAPTLSFDDTNISPASSVHPSEYTTDDDDEEAIAFKSLTEIMREHDIAAMSPNRSTSTSSGGSPWADGTGSSPVSSTPASGDPAFAEARQHLYDRQQKRRTGSVLTGADSQHPIDVTQFPTATTVRGKNNKKKLAMTPRTTVTASERFLQALELERMEIQRERIRRKDDTTKKQQRTTRVAVGLLPTRKELVVASHRRGRGRTAAQEARRTTKNISKSRRGLIPEVVVSELSPHDAEDDDISTIGGGNSPSHVVRQTLIQKGGGKVIVRQRARDDHHRSSSCCWVHRNDFELCLILLIAASLMTLVVLLALILATR